MLVKERRTLIQLSMVIQENVAIILRVTRESSIYVHLITDLTRKLNRAIQQHFANHLGNLF